MSKRIIPTYGAGPFRTQEALVPLPPARFVADKHGWGTCGTTEPNDDAPAVYVCDVAGHRIGFSPLIRPSSACPMRTKEKTP